jgi:hypothetical protein
VTVRNNQPPRAAGTPYLSKPFAKEVEMLTFTLRSSLIFCAALLPAACQDGGGPTAADAGADGGDTDTNGTDAGDDGGSGLPDCADGVAALPFAPAEDDPALYAAAAGFTLPTTDGDFDLAERWTGCDVYLFVQDAPAQNDDYGYEPWEIASDVRDLFERSPGNVHYFFMSYETDEGEIASRLDAWKAAVDAALDALGGGAAAQWADRVHYVTQSATALPGWLGDIMDSPGWGAAIDRFQRVRYIGSYADPAHYVASMAWPFGPCVSMLANEAIHYNYEAAREARLAADGAEVVTVFDDRAFDPNWETGENIYQSAEVALPDAAAMAGFDTLELDLYMGCAGDGELGYCPAWDGVFFLFLCDEGAESCDRETGTEIGRWITTYHREGRYVHDVSALLPLLAAGGTRVFSATAHDRYDVTLSMRFSNQGKPIRPTAIFPLFSANGGGNFTETYNDLFAEVPVDVPAGAVAVEIAAVITGHGMAMPGNCAEFCTIQHTFSVNGAPNVVEFTEPGNDYGCLEQVGTGTVPNQYGTWWYGRAGWCPGRQVDMVNVDVTDQIAVGAENIVAYEAWYGSTPYSGEGAGIEIKTWLVVYE